MVRKLVGKSFAEPVDESDLIIAKELLRQRFIVGLMGEMEESIRRFNIALGIDEESERNKECMVEFFGPKDVTTAGDDADKSRPTDKKNSNKHPKVSVSFELRNYIYFFFHIFEDISRHSMSTGRRIQSRV